MLQSVNYFYYIYAEEKMKNIHLSSRVQAYLLLKSLAYGCVARHTRVYFEQRETI